MHAADNLQANLAEIRRILHNLADHTQVLQELLTRGGLSAAFRQRLLVHIRYEEAENQRRLHQIKQAPGCGIYEVGVLIQHSELLSELTADEEQDPELIGAVLHHFAEEHEWIDQQLQRLEPAGSALPEASRPRRAIATVGSLLT